MFQKILNWIREVINKMIGKQDIQKIVGVDIAISNDMVLAIEEWAKLYRDDADWITEDVPSLSLPATIASELVRAATLEMEIKIDGGRRAEFLREQFEPVMDNLRQTLERGSALGGVIFKPYVDGNVLNVDYIYADQFYPLAFDGNGNITSAVFVDQRQVGKGFYTRLEIHQMIGDEYLIRNVAYKSQNKDQLGQLVNLDAVDDWATLEPEAVITGLERPLFAYYKYPLANHIDRGSPLGVSCYSRSINMIEQADKQWGRLLWEFESGERALYVDVLALKDGTGLPNKRLYKGLNGVDGAGVGDPAFYKEWSPTFREEQILHGLDAILKRIEFACGLAYGTLSDPQMIAKTATEIKTAKQRSYATVTDIQKEVRRVLEHLFYIMDVHASLANLAPAGVYSLTFDFDDSVLIDRESQMLHDMQLVQAGLMSKIEFRMRNFREAEDIARAAVAEIDGASLSFFPAEE